MPISRITIFDGSVQIFDENGVECVNFSIPINSEVVSHDEREIVVRVGDSMFIYGDRGQLLSSR